MFKKFYILHFTFYIIITPLLLVILSCTSSTDVSKGSLIGSVALENETDHSGISVSLYELAYLDTTIVRINNTYPHIGVKISQHTEFDHRMQTPIKTGTTAADGSFELKNIPTGTYNFVASKSGYGFRYIHEISISGGENLLSEELKIKNVNPVKYASHFTGQESKMKKPVISTGMEKSNSSRGTLSNNSKLRIQNSTLTLFPELHLSGDISEEIVVEPYHHLVCDDDVTFAPGSRLEIQPNAVVRIAPGADLTIMGNFKAQGEEDNMFWVTSNAGFENDELLMFNSKLEENYDPKNNSKLRIKNLKLIGDSLALYNSMELSDLAAVVDDLIEWGKWDWGNTCLLNQVNNLTMQNGIFRNGSCGFYSSDVDVTNCSNLNCSYLNDSEKGGVNYLNILHGFTRKSIFVKNFNGIKLKDKFGGSIENNYFRNNQNGLELWHFIGLIKNCEFCQNKQFDIKLYGNNGVETGNVLIEYNNFYSNIGISQWYYSFVYDDLNEVLIKYNNFFSYTYFIEFYPEMLNHDIIASDNFFDGITIIENIYDKIRNKSNLPGYNILIENLLIDENQMAGIEDGEKF